MKLEKIIISNFHCYQESIFEFGKNLTVLIGKNGSGKSSLIKAIKNALSVFFTYSNSNWEFDTIVGDVSDLKVANLGVREIWHDNNMKPATNVKIAVTTTEPTLEWSFVKSSVSDSKVQSKYYKEAFLNFRRTYGDKNAWPLFAYYSDRFPHIDAKLGDTVRKIIDKDDKLYRSWGYYHWDKDDSCALIWQKRYIRIYSLYYKRFLRFQKIEDKDSEEARLCNVEMKRYWDEIEYVQEYVKRFTSINNTYISDTSKSINVTEIIVDGGDKDSYLVAYFADGTHRRWDELPAGYERLYNIVFDIAYRSYILNGNVEPQGVVMIDEIDLHLHPTMEQDVLQRLLITFPNVQFIITTHSPLVIGNTQFGINGKAILLSFDGRNYTNQNITDPFGLDYDFILSAVMNTEPRNIKLQMLKDKYVRLMQHERVELATKTLNLINEMVVSDSRFLQIKEELNRKIREE